MAWRKKSDLKHISKLFVLVALLLLFFLGGWSQSNSNQSHDFDNDSWREAIEGINYGRRPEPEQEEPRESRQENNDSNDRSSSDYGDNSWFDNWADFFGGGTIGKIIMVAVIIALIFMIIFLIIRVVGDPEVKLKKSDIGTYTLEEIEENLHESDLEKHLREALANGDYKTAIRVYYLSIIKNLSIKELIVWKREKTNFDYVREMFTHQYHGQFNDVTINFERIWYGDRPITKMEYDMLSPGFKKFHSLIDVEE